MAYVHIRTMLQNTMAQDYLHLMEFYEQIGDFEHLIIDIRGNGGGSDQFFTHLVMTPNISEPLHFSHYMFVQAGEHNMRFLMPRQVLMRFVFFL